jgi:hypothetical protein
MLIVFNLPGADSNNYKDKKFCKTPKSNFVRYSAD